MPSSAMKKCSSRAPGVPSPASKRSLRDGVLNQRDVAIEVEPERAGANLAHGDHRRQVPLLAAANQGHRRAVARRFHHAQLDVCHRDHGEAILRVAFSIDVREHERHLRSVARGPIEQVLDQRPGMAVAAAVGFGEHGADAADAHGLLVDDCRKGVLPWRWRAA